MNQISALCATYCTSSDLKPVKSGLRNGKFSGLLDKLTPPTHTCLKIETLINFVEGVLLRDCVR